MIDDCFWRLLLRLRVQGPEASDALSLSDQADGGHLLVLLAELAGKRRDQVHVLAHLGQSLDGRIATDCGNSHYINGPESLELLHRLRALVDAVVIGVETAIRDCPRLTTRRVGGPSPVRVVIDPRGRLPEDHNLRSDGLSPTIVLTRRAQFEGDLELPGSEPRFRPQEIIGVLAERGLFHLLIEGGGRTVSAFLEAGALDRLQLAVAPMIIGSGRPSISLAPIETLEAALRPSCRSLRLGSDTLFDMRFERVRN